MAWSELTYSRHEPGQAGTVVYRLSGIFTNSSQAYAFLEKVREDVKAGAKHLVLDLENVPHLTSGGIGLLCAAFMSLHNAGGRMTLVAIGEKNRTLLRVVGLLDRIGLVDSEEDALKG